MVMEVCISMSHKMQIKVVSKKYLEVRDLILHRIDRGVTLINGETGFEGKDTKIVLSVISNRELAKLERMVKALDPDAFIIISRVSEVKGRGFTKEKFYASKHGEHEPRPLLEEQTDTALSGMETEGIHLDEDTPAQED